jgi:hypothetical protein
MFLPSKCPKVRRFAYCFIFILGLIPSNPLLLGDPPQTQVGEGRAGGLTLRFPGGRGWKGQWKGMDWKRVGYGSGEGRECVTLHFY